MASTDKGHQSPKYQQIADALRAAIQSGEYSPGDRLPPENDLMAKYGVARMTVRHAYGALREEGLVESRKGAGVYARDPAASPAVEVPPGLDLEALARDLNVAQEAIQRIRTRLGIQ